MIYPQMIMKETIEPHSLEEIIAFFLYRSGCKPGSSTNIADQTTRGYGKLDNYGFWEFPVYTDYEGGIV